jgi:vacuolar iron transporter family protein
MTPLGPDIAGGRPAQQGRIGGNALRASVLGANDGLVSNLSLVMCVAGAGLDHHVCLITGGRAASGRSSRV